MLAPFLAVWDYFAKESPHHIIIFKKEEKLSKTKTVESTLCKPCAASIDILSLPSQPRTFPLLAPVHKIQIYDAIRFPQ